MRILIYRLGSLGDTVLALPCFRLIRETYPAAHITVLTNAPVSGKAAPLEAVLTSSGLIDEVHHYPLGLRDPRKLLRLGGRLHAGKFDLLISLAGARGFLASVRDLVFFKACGIPKIMGIPFSKRDLVPSLRADGTLFESEAEKLLRRISPLGQVDLAEGRWLDPGLTLAEKAEATGLLAAKGISGKFIAASVGTKSPLNDWGTANWTELLGRLSANHPTLGLALLGTADEYNRSQKLLADWKGASANFCGTTSPRVSAGILEYASAFVGHDSGPMHLAASVGTRCVAIFSARCPPGQWFPVGAGHVPLYPRAFYDPRLTGDLKHQQEALASIRVDEVLAAVESIILRDGVPQNFATS